MILEDPKKVKTIQFIGTRNKTDFVLYLAHVLTTLDKRVLVVDGTRNEWYRHGYTRLENGQQLFDFQGIDILCGAANWLNIELSLKKVDETTVGYDVILLDMDTPEMLRQEWPVFNERFYVGDFDRAHQQHDIQLLHTLFRTTGNNELKRITFETTYKLDVAYFDSLLGEDVQWRSMNYLFEPDDMSEGLRAQMQHELDIPYRRLNKQYKELLTEIVSALYELHVKDVDDAVRPPMFRNPFKRTREGLLEGSNA